MFLFEREIMFDVGIGRVETGEGIDGLLIDPCYFYFVLILFVELSASNGWVEIGADLANAMG